MTLCNIFKIQYLLILLNVMLVGFREVRVARDREDLVRNTVRLEQVLFRALSNMVQIKRCVTARDTRVNDSPGECDRHRASPCLEPQRRGPSFVWMAAGTWPGGPCTRTRSSPMECVPFTERSQIGHKGNHEKSLFLVSLGMHSWISDTSAYSVCIDLSLRCLCPREISRSNASQMGATCDVSIEAFQRCDLHWN